MVIFYHPIGHKEFQAKEKTIASFGSFIFFISWMKPFSSANSGDLTSPCKNNSSSSDFEIFVSSVMVFDILFWSTSRLLKRSFNWNIVMDVCAGKFVTMPWNRKDELGLARRSSPDKKIIVAIESTDPMLCIMSLQGRDFK